MPRTAHLQNRPRETQLPEPLCPGSVEHFDKSRAPEYEICIILTWAMPFAQTVYWIHSIAASWKSWVLLFCPVSHLLNCINSLADSFNSGLPEMLKFHHIFYFSRFWDHHLIKRRMSICQTVIALSVNFEVAGGVIFRPPAGAHFYCFWLLILRSLIIHFEPDCWFGWTV